MKEDEVYVQEYSIRGADTHEGIGYENLILFKIIHRGSVLEVIHKADILENLIMSHVRDLNLIINMVRLQ